MTSGAPPGMRLRNPAAATRTAAVQSSCDTLASAAGQVPCPGTRRPTTVKPSARSRSATARIEYGESLRP